MTSNSLLIGFNCFHVSLAMFVLFFCYFGNNVIALGKFCVNNDNNCYTQRYKEKYILYSPDFVIELKTSNPVVSLQKSFLVKHHSF